VGGWVLFARTSKALSRLQQMMRERKIQRVYYALVENCLAETKGILTHCLKRLPFRSEITTPGSKEGKKSILEYQVIERKEKTTLIKIILITGRYHQIRAQLAATGFPILGDKKYGSTLPYSPSLKKTFNSSPGIALYHSTLKLVHPVTGKELLFHQPPFSF